MKKILFPILVLILVACTSTLPQTQVTVTSIVTVTLPPTATFTPVTPEPTDTLTPIPTATPFRYTSCVDKELIAEQDRAFEERTGIVLNNPSDERSLRFKQAMEEKGFYSFSKKTDIIGFPLFKTGTAEVKVVDIPGISKIVCLFGRNVFLPETVAVATGWIDSLGKYQSFTGTNEVDDPLPVKVFADGQEQLKWIKDMPDGAVIIINVHTFSGVVEESDIITNNPSNSDNPLKVRKFVRQMMVGGNDLLRRYSPLFNKYDVFWKAQNSANNDVGFIPADYWTYFPSESPDLSR